MPPTRLLLPLLLATPLLSAQSPSEVVAEAFRISRSGRILEAYDKIRPWLDELGEDPLAHGRAGDILAKAHRHQRAYEHLLRAHRLDPQNPQYAYDTANQRTRQCRYQEALNHWRTLEALPFPADMDPTTQARLQAEAAFQRARCAKEVGLLPEAREAAGRAVSMTPDEEDRRRYRNELGGILLDSHDYEEAAKQFSLLAEQVPGDARHHYHKGVALLHLGRLEPAEAALKKARALDGGDHRTCLKLADLYLRQDRLDHAEGALLASIEVNPKAQQAYYSLARVATLQGRRDEAARYRKQYETLQAQADELTEKQRALRRRFINDPTDEEARLESALVFLRNGRRTEAWERFMQLLSINPGHALAGLNMAVMYVHENRLKAGLLELDRVLEHHPGHAPANFESGRILSRMARFREAIPYYEKALAGLEEPRRAVAAHAELSQAYARTGNREQAARHIQAARALAARLKTKEGDGQDR